MGLRIGRLARARTAMVVVTIITPRLITDLADTGLCMVVWVA